MHRSVFLKELKELFPQLREEVNHDLVAGMLAMEMTVFHQFTQKLIYDGSKEQLLQAFMLADKCYKQGNSSLKDVIDTCFVEGLDFRGNKWAWEMMPSSLKQLYLDFPCNPRLEF